MEKDFLYRRIADSLRDSMLQGSLRPGDVLPSIRKLCRQRRISPATAMAAYAWLEAQGRIQVRPRSGYYVRDVTLELPKAPLLSAPAASPTAVTVGDMVSRLLAPARRRDEIPLGAAVPALELLPTQALNALTGRVAREMGPEARAYLLPPGHASLRREIAKRSLLWGGGPGLHPENCLITSGCLEALNLSLRAVVKPGDIVAIESPTYFALLQAMENLGIRALEIPTHPRTGIDLDALDSALKRHAVKACLLSPNFNNPLGSLMPEANKERLYEMLAKRDLPLVEDDIYGDLHYGSQRPKPIKAFDKKGLVLHCASFSKTLDPGARVGWVSPGRYLERVSRLKVMNTLASATLPQAVLAQFLASGAYERHLRRLRPALEKQMNQLFQAVLRHFPADTKAALPEGGFTLWVELPKRVNAVTLAEAAEQKGIRIAPGPIFSPRGRFASFVRLSAGNPWSPRLEVAMETLGRIAALN